MKLSLSLLALPASLLSAAYAAAAAAAAVPATADYSEHLHLKPLAGGSLYAGFNFTTSTPLVDYDNQHFRFFPRSLAQILQYTHTAELHLRFALGRWDEESWGSRPRNGRREGGTGVELWAWIEADSRADAEERWTGLVNSLSGLFCASLNFIDQSKTIQPILTFEPEGTLRPGNASLHLMHGMLPHEVVCTENLTPFLKLLPCKGKAGVSSLLDGHKVFDANWQTMSIDVRPRCDTAEDCSLELSQTVDMVLDLERSMRPQDNPIPRPPPVEQIPCDETKAYNAQDTCYPKRLAGDMAWSISRIFGRPIHGSCPLNSEHNSAVVTLNVPTSRLVEVKPSTASYTHADADGAWRSYQLKENEDFDLELPQQEVQHDRQGATSLIRASRQITGYGQERGGMHTVIVNPHSTPQRMVYLESLPWYLRPYTHTLKITGATTEKMYYTPAVDRRKGTHLELLLNVPAFSTVELTYDFEKAILRYTEYPPDANRGFDVAPAIIRVLPESNHGEDSYLRTTSLLLPLPTPDFSMPYNVIILTSTVIALGFGSIFNLLIRRFVLLEEAPKAPLNGLLGKLRMKLDRLRGKRVLSGDGADSLTVKEGLDSKSAVIASGSTLDHDLGTLYSRKTGTRLATTDGRTSDR